MLFHKSGPLYGQPRGYAFVTYEATESATRALTKLSGHQVGCKTMVIRFAKNINYDELERPGGRGRLDIPALTGSRAASSVGAAAASPTASAAATAAAAAASNAKKLTTQSTIHAIEAKLRSLENNAGDLVINQGAVVEPPLIHRYQYNNPQQQQYQQQQQDGRGGGHSGRGGRYGGGSSRGRYAQGPYNRRGGSTRR